MKRIELHAGLGDILLCIYGTTAYECLTSLAADERVPVYINSHNPFVSELFEWHPARDRLDIVVSRQFFPAHTNELIRVKHGFPPRIFHGPFLPRDKRPLTYYPSPHDEAVLAELLPRRPYLLAALSASSVDRSIPEDISSAAIECCRKHDVPVVLVGRRYKALFDPLLGIRHEEEVVKGANVVDLIDRLSIPGTAIALKGATAMLSCHSSLNLMGWCEGRPQFLCYPQSAFDRHFRNGDVYAFGKDFETTDHMLFSDFSVERFERFLLKTF